MRTLLLISHIVAAILSSRPTLVIYPKPTVVQGAKTSGVPTSWLTQFYGPKDNVNPGGSYTCFHYGCGLQAVVNFGAAQNYNFNVTACMQQAPALPTTGLVLWFLDQGAVGWGNTTAFAQQITHVDTGAPCPTTATYTWSMPVQSGNHLVQLLLYTDPNTFITINTASITVAAGTVTAEPAGSRDVINFPFSSYSLWNTAIGSGAVWSAPTDGDTITLDGLAGAINSGSFSMPVYIGQASDPLRTFFGSQSVFTPNPNIPAHIPSATAASPDSDARLVVLDRTQSRYAFQGLETCSVSSSGVSCAGSQIHDNCNPAVDYGVSQQNYAGLIRSADLTQGAIKHMLSAGFSFNATKAVSTVFSGQWPNWGADFCGTTGCYTGGTNGLLYGSTFGIPSDVDCTSLGLTTGGLMLCHALQDYGAIEMVSAGTSQVTLYAEQALTGNVTLSNMTSDFNSKLVSKLRILRNQGPSTPNGGGSPRQPMLPGLAVCQGVH